MISAYTGLPVPTKVFLGSGALEQLGELAAPFGGPALIVCGRTAVRAHGFLDRAVKALTDAGVAVHVFDEVSPNPRAEEVDRAVALARRSGCSTLVGLGGGSAIDATKAVAAAYESGSVRELIGRTLPPDHPVPTVIAVPTTAGSGSEVTKGAIITDSVRNFRSGVRGACLFPKVALIDPELFQTMPAEVALATAFDAFAHAVEGTVSAASTEQNLAYARRAAGLIAETLPLIIDGRMGPGDRAKTAEAALLGGVNVATASTCLPHRMQQAMGSVPRVGISHGHGLAVLYPAWLRSAEPFAKGGFDAIAEALGRRELLPAVADIRRAAGLDRNLSAFGFTRQDVDVLVQGVSGNLDNDPHTTVDTDLIRRIYLDSL